MAVGSPMTNMWEIYKVKEGKIHKDKQECPRCGTGVYMAEHENRYSCGKCGYTDFKRKE
jgi:small subunit ribosomal protein S27Ae